MSIDQQSMSERMKVMLKRIRLSTRPKCMMGVNLNQLLTIIALIVGLAAGKCARPADIT
jgi:hypothetical protein